jgi:hypothetical protein
MTENAYVLEHTIEVDVRPSFAWKYRTNIETWNDPPATFVLDGAFVEGARGTTVTPDQEPLHWWIRTVDPQRLFVIEVPLEGASLWFEWHFFVVTEHRTRLIQRIRLDGPESAAYTKEVTEGFGPTLAEGMNRLANDMSGASASIGPK